MTFRCIRLLIWSLLWRPPQGVTLTFSLTPASGHFTIVLRKCCMIVTLVVETKKPTRIGLWAKLRESAGLLEKEYESTHVVRATVDMIPHLVRGGDGA